MRAIREARKFIEASPTDPSAQLLARLVLALESEADFHIAQIYQLNFDQFNLALEVLREWRLDRYYAGKGRLLDLSMQVGALPNPGEH